MRRGDRELHAARAGPAGSRLRGAAGRHARTSSCSGCRASGSTGPGATRRRSPSSSRTPRDSPGSPATPTSCRSSRTASATPTPGCTPCTACCSRWSTATKTGQGGLVEAAMVDAALNVTAEQVIEHSAYGTLLSRGRQPGPVRGAAEPLPGSRARRRTAATTAGSPSRSPPTSNGRRSAVCWASPRGPPTPPWRPRRGACGRTTESTQFCGDWCRDQPADEVVELSLGGRCARRQGRPATPPAGAPAARSPAASSRTWTIR